MKKLNLKLIKGGKDYRATIAVCNGIPVKEFLSLLNAAFPIPGASIVGFRDIEGLLIIPSLICSNTEILKADDYELILKEKTLNSSFLKDPARVDEEISGLKDWIRDNNETVAQVYQSYIVKHDLGGFMQWLLQDRPQDNSVRPDERPTTSRVGDRPKTDNHDIKSYQNYIQIMSEMESQGLLEQVDVRIIKALILRENIDVMREFDHYFLHSINLDELGNRLQKLADRLNTYMDRPSSPMPKNNQLQSLVESFLGDSLMDSEDIEVLKKLITEENEFVVSAFDVYESDRDQVELIDSLMRAVDKYRKVNQDSIRSSSFY
jgi:hypothetical protein